MTSLLKRVWRMLNGDLLGREQVVEQDHPDLGPIVYFGAGPNWPGRRSSSPRPAP